MESLSILYRDSSYVAVNKPSGLLVHRTGLTAERVNCLALLRDQLGQWVYPVHRLDRATSGVLIFALSSDDARRLSELFLKKEIKKEYLAIVRGYLAESGVIERPLREDKSKIAVTARSSYTTLGQVELPVAVGTKHSTSRYSLVRVSTETGRLHQIRKHFSGIFHPIIGDTVYGDGRHNKYFREHLSVWRLLLHAQRITFTHPHTGVLLDLQAPLPDEFLSLCDRFGWKNT